MNTRKTNGLTFQLAGRESIDTIFVNFLLVKISQHSEGNKSFAKSDFIRILNQDRKLSTIYSFDFQLSTAILKYASCITTHDFMLFLKNFQIKCRTKV